MKRYRKKPVVIEAQRIVLADFDDDHPDSRHIEGVIYDPLNLEVVIRTLEGHMKAGLGDYIIRGVKGELYPCRAAIFALMYEEVRDDDA